MNTPELADVTNAVALLLHGFDDANDDDGKVSATEIAFLFTSMLPAMVKAIKGAGGLGAELRRLDTETMRELYNSFLTTLQWQPDDNTRDKFAVASDAAFALIEAAVKWRNTTNPPKAVPV